MRGLISEGNTFSGASVMEVGRRWEGYAGFAATRMGKGGGGG
jgi:hypothetical protein